MGELYSSEFAYTEGELAFSARLSRSRHQINRGVGPFDPRAQTPLGAFCIQAGISLRDFDRLVTAISSVFHHVSHGVIVSQYRPFVNTSIDVRAYGGHMRSEDPLADRLMSSVWGRHLIRLFSGADGSVSSGSMARLRIFTLDLLDCLRDV